MSLFVDREGDDGLPGRERRVAMLCILVFTAMGVLDTALVTIALPTMARDLGVTQAQSVWIVGTYQLAGAASILAFSSLGAMLGFRRLFIGGLLAFTLASLGCALSGSYGVLLVMRFLQGLGAAAAMCVTAALYRRIFPQRLLGSALGMNALVVAAAMAVGPTLGGAIVSAVPWVWLFAINVPLGAGALWFVARVLPAEGRRRHRFDVAGAASSALAVGCLVLAMYQLARPGGLYAGTLLLAVAAAAAVVFLRIQASVRAPLLALDIFRNERVSLATLTSIAANIGQGIGLMALPFLLQGRYGFSPVVSGLLFTPMPAGIMLAAPLAGRLADHRGSPALATAGLATLAVGYAILGALDPEHASVHQIALGVFACGFGFGLFQTPNNREFLATVEPARLGNASGLLTFSRSVGLTIGTVVAALLALLAHASSARGPGVHLASLWVAAGAAAFATAISAARLRRFARRPP